MIGSRGRLVATALQRVYESFNDRPMSLSFQNPARQRGISASGLEAGIPEPKRECPSWVKNGNRAPQS
jgi:hypothetical protein